MKPSGRNELPKDRAELLHMAEEQGWTLSVQGNGHSKLTNPKNGRCVIVLSTPGDSWRGVKIFRAQLRTAGLLPQDVWNEIVERRRARAMKKPDEIVYSTPDSEPARLPIPAMGARPVEQKPRKKGELKSVIFEAINRMGNIPQGRSIDDILPRVQLVRPDVDRNKLGISLHGYVASGVMKLAAPGRYVIVPEDEIVKPVKGTKPQFAAPTFAPPTIPLDMDTQADLKALDDILREMQTIVEVANQGMNDAIGKFEAIVRKHQSIAQGLAPLRAMLSAMAPKPPTE